MRAAPARVTIGSMKRKLSLLLSVVLIAAYTAKNVAAGQFATSLWFMLPPLLVDLIAVTLIFRVWGKDPEAQDDTWRSFAFALLASHLFLVANLLGVSLVGDGAYRPVQLAGGFVLLATYPVTGYALLTLGSSFSILPEAKRLVTTGPYRFSRHPLYATYIAWYVCFLAIGQSWQALALAVTGSALQLYRADREEQVLLETFGEEYEAYRATTMWIGRRRAA